MSDLTLIHDLHCNHVALLRDGPTIFSRAIDEIRRLIAERDELKQQLQFCKRPPAPPPDDDSPCA